LQVGATAPGEVMRIDSTLLDVMVLLDEGVTGRVELTALVDIATRSITQFGKTHQAIDAARHLGLTDRIPVLYVTVPPAATPRMVAAEFARFLGPPVTTRANITEAVCGVAVDARVSVVAVDEIHNLALATRNGAEASDTLSTSRNVVLSWRNDHGLTCADAMWTVSSTGVSAGSGDGGGFPSRPAGAQHVRIVGAVGSGAHLGHDRHGLRVRVRFRLSDLPTSCADGRATVFLLSPSLAHGSEGSRHAT
jgi:hypothetical protein